MPYGPQTVHSDSFMFTVVRDSDGVDVVVRTTAWHAMAGDADKDLMAQDIMDALSGMPGYTVTATKMITGGSELTANP